MINLLPPEVKAEIAYSKINTSLFKLMGIILAAGSVLLITLYLGSRNQQVRLTSAEQQVQQRKTNAKLEKTLRDVNIRVKTISTINASRHVYSTFMKRLAGALPGDAQIDSILLSSDAKAIKLSVAMKSNGATGMKDRIAKLPEIQTVEVESINQDSSGFTVSVGITFKPEAFK